MKKCALAVSVLLIFSNTSFSQSPIIGDNTFIPRERVLFDNDFRIHTPAVLPDGWNANVIRHKFFEIGPDKIERQTDDADVARIKLKSSKDSSTALPDSFTFECDVFFFSAHTLFDICLYHPKDDIKDSSWSEYCYGFAIWERKMGTGNWEAGHLPHFASPPLKYFDINGWHHFGLSYYHGVLKYFVDGKCLLSITNCGYKPDYLEVHNWKPVKYGEIKLCTGRELNPFSKLLTERKLISHAIHFNVNEATIIPESMGYITLLATMLKENPTVRLEIDGHTDSDGNTTANITLSQLRANEVKKQLILQGIEGSRVIAKGWGATKPLQPNTTSENKAENRRVEFIKL